VHLKTYGKMKKQTWFYMLILVAIGTGLFTLTNSGCNKKSDNSTPTPSDTGVIKDYDGNVYHSVTIGTQVWLVEGLKTTHYRNGDPITAGKSGSRSANLLAQGEYWNYGNSDSLGKIYGRLYNFYAVIDPRNIAPHGWRVATNDDMTALSAYLGADSIAGGKLKEAGTAHWASPNIGATNESGFTALPGGNYNAATGFFSFLRYGTTIWTNTEHGADEGYVITLYSNTGSFFHGYSVPKFGGATVRCLKGD
jgi:uncharacterized protein (TIGR02145 family)